MIKMKVVGILLAFPLFISLLSMVHAESWHGAEITTDIAWDSGDYGGGETINTYSGTITIDYRLKSNLSLSVSMVPYIYQNKTYTDIVLLRGKVIHYKDRYGNNPHQEKNVVISNDLTISEYDESHNAASNNNYIQSNNNQAYHENTFIDVETNNHQLIDSINETHNIIHVDHQAHHDKNEHNQKVAEVIAQRNVQTSKGYKKKLGNNSEEQYKDENDNRQTLRKQKFKRRGSASGLGDMTLKISYFILDETELLPQTAIKAGIKFPTADEDKGLGTGEFDYLFGMDVTKNIGRWSLFGGVSYNILGDPDYYDLNNYVSGYAGISTEVLPNFYTSVELDAAGAASDESDSELSLGLELGYDFGTPGYLAAGVAKGLSDGSPDFSLYMSYSISF